MLMQNLGRRLGLAAAGLVLAGGAYAVGGTDFNVGDDLIGTLPVVYPENPLDGLASGPEGLDPGSPAGPESSFTLTGTAADLEALVLDAYGEGYVEVAETGTIGVYDFDFVGDVNLVLDRDGLERSRVRSALRPGLADLGGLGFVSWKGQHVSAFGLDQAALVVPFDGLLGGGVLDQGAVSVLLQGLGGGQTYVDLSTSAGQVFVDILDY